MKLNANERYENKINVSIEEIEDKYIIDNNLPHTLNFKREDLVNDK